MKNQSRQGKKRKLSEDDDEETLFCRSLIPRLKRLNPIVKASARIQIEEVFFQLKFANPSWSTPNNPVHIGNGGVRRTAQFQQNTFVMRQTNPSRFDVQPQIQQQTPIDEISQQVQQTSRI